MRYLLALLLPPLAVLSTGRLGATLVNAVLTLCLFIPGVIHAILVVHGYEADKRTERTVAAIQGSHR